MKSDIKKKFLDILFEPEEQDDELFERDEPAPKKTRSSSEPVKARDVLYRKSESSVFVNLDDNQKVKETAASKPNEYEFSSQISPIFGVMKDTQRKPQKPRPIDENYTSKPEDSHLDIITSPIYGYGERDVRLINGYDDYSGSYEDDDELHALFSDTDQGYSRNHTYDDLDSDGNDEEISLFSPYDEED